MTESTAKPKKKRLKKPTKKTGLILIAIALAAVLGTLLITSGILGGLLGGQPVEFTQLKNDQIPQAIEKDVIPEYRDLERALGCLIDDKVYVIVTRGEKPTAGYDLKIEKMQLEKTDTGSNLVVTALFTEPAPDETVSKIITYPYVVAETELTGLPDTIQLAVRYAE